MTPRQPRCDAPRSTRPPDTAVERLGSLHPSRRIDASRSTCKDAPQDESGAVPEQARLPSECRSPLFRKLLQRFPNLVLLRTFSKCFGFAGARVGYALGSPQFRSAVDAVRQPFSINSLAQAGAAEAILHQDDALDRVERNAIERLHVEEGIRELGFSTAETEANFSWLDLGDRDEDELTGALARAGVAVRPGTPLGGPGHIRVTYGTRPENDRFLAALADAV